MATLSGGHFAVDFASGAVPALLPFFALEFDLSYTATAVADARGARVVVARPAALRALVRPAWRALAAARRAAALRRPARGSRAVAPSYWLVVVLVFVAGHRHRGVPPRGREVRRVRERAQARERHVFLQHRRQHRLRARPDRRHAARAVARARGRLARDASGPRRRPLPAPRCCLGSAGVAPAAAAHGGRARATTTARDDACSAW